MSREKQISAKTETKTQISCKQTLEFLQSWASSKGRRRTAQSPLFSSISCPLISGCLLPACLVPLFKENYEYLPLIPLEKMTENFDFSLTAVCGLDCGLHGQCLGSSCVCYPGWQGPRCNLRACDDRCKEHGQCINGTCVCQRGFNGRYCGFDACGPNCHGQGTCENMAEDEDNQRPIYE